MTDEPTANGAATPDPEPSLEYSAEHTALMHWQEVAHRAHAWLGRHFGQPWLANYLLGYDLPVPPAGLVPSEFSLQLDVRNWQVKPGGRDNPPMCEVRLITEADNAAPYFTELKELMESHGTTVIFRPYARQQTLFGAERTDLEPEPQRCVACGTSVLDEALAPTSHLRGAVLQCLDTAACLDRREAQQLAQEQPHPTAAQPPESAPVDALAAAEPALAAAPNGTPDAEAWADPPPPTVEPETLERISRGARRAAAPV